MRSPFILFVITCVDITAINKNYVYSSTAGRTSSATAYGESTGSCQANDGQLRGCQQVDVRYIHTADLMDSSDLEHESARCEAEADDEESPSSKAVVLYNPTHLQPFHLSMRTFHFAGRDFSIKQKWADFGVAAVVWDAAIVLSEYLVDQHERKALNLAGKRVIEIGAGTGLVGMVAATLHADTTITDRSEVLVPLRENVHLNFPSSSHSSSPSSSTVLQAEDDPDISDEQTVPTSSSSSSLPVPPPPIPPSIKELTWGQNLEEYPQPFDIILGADIIYIEDTFDDLLKTLVHLTSSDSLILLSCRIRYDRDERFLDMLRDKFCVTEVFLDDKKVIKIYSAKKLGS